MGSKRDASAVNQMTSGQATLEYILLLSVILFGVSAMGASFIKTLNRGIFLVGGTLEKDLRTGRVNLGAWNN